MVRLRQFGNRLLPKGGVDAGRQLLLFVGAYILYQVVRGLVSRDDAPAVASWNATKVIDLERRLHLFIEPSVQHWALNYHWLLDLMTWFYVNGNYAISGGALVWIYLRRNDSFYFMRNAFLIAMAIALVGYTVFPTAPPRLMPEWGFTDVVQQVTGITAERGSTSEFLNLYAAIPSMHVCFAMLTGASMLRFSRLWIARIAWILYPPFVALVVIATGNHYLTDVVLGAVTAGLSALFARELLARARPDAWAFGSRARLDRRAV